MAMAEGVDFDSLSQAGGGHAAEVYGYWLELQGRGLAPYLLEVVDEVKPAGPSAETQVPGNVAALAAGCGTTTFQQPLFGGTGGTPAPPVLKPRLIPSLPRPSKVV
jgi:hypothetical protein